jgi:hypothetical protein
MEAAAMTVGWLWQSAQRSSEGAANWGPRCSWWQDEQLASSATLG